MSTAKVWRCPSCDARNDDAHRVCQTCYEWRPKHARATKAADRLRAGDRVLGYEMDADLRPVRRYVER